MMLSNNEKETNQPTKKQKEKKKEREGEREKRKLLVLGNSKYFSIGIDQSETGWPILERSLKKLLPGLGCNFEILIPN